MATVVPSAPEAKPLEKFEIDIGHYRDEGCTCMHFLFCCSTIRFSMSATHTLPWPIYIPCSARKHQEDSYVEVHDLWQTVRDLNGEVDEGVTMTLVGVYVFLFLFFAMLTAATIVFSCM